MELAQIRVYRRGGEVARYHTEPTIIRETVAHHSANVAFIAMYIAEAVTPNLVYMALVHDTAEGLTGDVPYPVKHQFPALKQYLDGIEENFLRRNQMFVQITEDETAVIKAADMLDLVLKCLDEMDMGNRRFLDIFETGVAVLNKMVLPPYTRLKIDEILEGIGEWTGLTTDKSAETTIPENSNTGT